MTRDALLLGHNCSSSNMEPEGDMFLKHPSQNGGKLKREDFRG